MMNARPLTPARHRQRCSPKGRGSRMHKMRVMMMIFASLMLVLAPLALTGCQSTPLQRYEAASAVYDTGLRGVQLAAAAGELDADDLSAIEPYRAAIRAALDEAQRIIDSTGTLTEGDARVFEAALNAWLDAMLARQGVVIDPETGQIAIEEPLTPALSPEGRGSKTDGDGDGD